MSLYDPGCLECLRALGMVHDDDLCPRCSAPCDTCLQPQCRPFVLCDDLCHSIDPHKYDDDYHESDYPAPHGPLIWPADCRLCHDELTRPELDEREGLCPECRHAIADDHELLGS